MNTYGRLPVEETVFDFSASSPRVEITEDTPGADRWLAEIDRSLLDFAEDKSAPSSFSGVIAYLLHRLRADCIWCCADCFSGSADRSDA
jgi:hypothetical protein